MPEAAMTTRRSTPTRPLIPPASWGRVVIASSLFVLAAGTVGPDVVAASFALTAASLITWRAKSPATFRRFVSGPLFSWFWRTRIRSEWEGLCTSCGLSVPTTPEIKRVRGHWPRVEVRTRPSVGQTYSDFERAGEALRLGTGASQVHVEPYRQRDVIVTFTITDLLREPFAAAVGSADRLAAVTMGRRSDGRAWELPIGPHTLVAGCSGSGKGSLFWSFVFGLAPAVHDGRVQLHGVDLKGGMEILLGADLFTTKATAADEAVVLMERLVHLMQDRAQSYAGERRDHGATVDAPLHVLMIDELAALTAYCSDRDLRRRAEAALNLLCSQGRAPGFMVFACLQDPRKEVIPSRGLFTQMIGLRLKDISESAMVLGESAVLNGATCHRISSSEPGTGYLINETSGHPIRVRAGFASDSEIRAISKQLAAPSATTGDEHA